MLDESRLDYHDPEWVASRLGIDKNAVYKYLTQGMLPGLRLGRKWLISESSLLDFLKGEERHQTEGRRAMFSVETLLADEIDVPIGLFSERARRVLGVALQEAQALNHDYIGGEHLLLGLVRDTDGVAAKVLKNLGVLEGTQAGLEAEMEQGRAPELGEDPISTGGGDVITWTARAQDAIKHASSEALRMGHHYIGTEHLLLGLLDGSTGPAHQIFESLEISVEDAGREITRVLAQALPDDSAQQEGENRG
jgi:excisionase family DNA binding protein